MAHGTYGAALAYLLGRDHYGSGLLAADTAPSTERGKRSTFDLKPRPTHFPPRAKAVIQLVMQGGPSHIDLFDPKPRLAKLHGQQPSKEILTKTDLDLDRIGGMLPSPFRFAQHGGSGIWLSELLPHLARQVDHIAVIRSMFTTHPNHEPALYKLQSGRLQSGFPCLGSWVVYGLGSENQSLPAYVVLGGPDRATAHQRRAKLAGRLPASALSGRPPALDRLAAPQPAAPGRAAARNRQHGAAICWPGSIASTNESGRASCGSRRASPATSSRPACNCKPTKRST